ncbi:hypothetical protein KVR01_013515 [Diaporthe batatas]|uniref:uncharacterized protein n=1 Tax=Diaporthe batatas TaxID=748121 RepID=UPI001D03C998|nr:uncharacterized protein KVR01_013515 [Diaporthe batatas]KAG8156564.1 hypothetical protein KVR01_013515 [Diaporthe batatas]
MQPANPRLRPDNSSPPFSPSTSSLDVRTISGGDHHPHHHHEHACHPRRLNNNTLFAKGSNHTPPDDHPHSHAMAAVIGDFANHSGFHTMIATQGLPYSQESSHASSHYRSSSHSRSSTPRNHPPASRQQSSRASPRFSATSTTDSAASRLPSPPDSSSGSTSAGAASASQSDEDLKARYTSSVAQDGQKQVYMESSAAHQPAQGFSAAGAAAADCTPNSSSQTVAGSAQPSQVLPSPASNSGDRWGASQSTLNSSPTSPTQQQTTIKVRDLAHVQALARSGMGFDDDVPLQSLKYDLSECPIGDVIEMVAALLTKITTTNDQQHDALSRNAVERNASHVKQAQAQNDGLASENSMSPLSSSVLAFHGKNVPAITILSYLSRIHKYCPTTFEVFLSLLVYFDRMTERVNDIVMKAEEAKKSGHAQDQAQADVVMKEAPCESSDSDEDLDEDIVDDSDSEGERPAEPKRAQASGTGKASGTPSAASQPTFFVVDSFNIHRLIISGVTCASKFFSDVFYTNSRYAKVGGLPLAELNHLEIQFLLLNDFRLAIQVEDLEAYATMLVEFYAREVVSRPGAGPA